MSNGKGLATVAIWAGTVVLCYMFHSFDILSGGGAGGMVIGALLVTGAIWD